MAGDRKGWNNPIVLLLEIGPHLMEEYGLMPLTSGYLHSYDPNVKVQLTNEFTTAAFRFGHSLISNFDE